jgi:hypothetical protein
MSDNKLSPIGKLFFASVIGWIFGKKLNMKLRGDPEKVQAVANAIIASKKFQDELKKPGATIESVLKALNLKKEMAKQFEEISGMPWPL